MSERWAALIDLPPDKQQRLAAILTRLDTRPDAMAWDLADRPPPSVPPTLIVATIEGFTENHDQLGALQPRSGLHTTVLLAPAAPTAATLRLQLDYDLPNVIPDVLWFDETCLERTVRGLLFPRETFDIRTFLPGATLFECFEVSTLAEKHQIADEVSQLVGRYTGTQRLVRDIHLIINELINNAFFHSFRNPDGEEKYAPRFFSQLEEGESVMLEVTAGDRGIAIGVEDNSGTLYPREVLKYLLRQTTGEGVYDSHGRGFYLITSLADHVSICLAPGKRARIVSLRHVGGAKPLATLSFFVVS